MQISKSRFLPLPGSLGFQTKTRRGCGLVVTTTTSVSLLFRSEVEILTDVYVRNERKSWSEAWLEKNDAIALFFRS
jgi:hypothetical protein